MGHIILAGILIAIGIWRFWDNAMDGPIGLLIGFAIFALCVTAAAGILIGGLLYAVPN